MGHSTLNVFDRANLTFYSGQSFNLLGISRASLAVMATSPAGAPYVLNLNALAITPPNTTIAGGVLDLNNNKIWVNYGLNSDPISAVVSYLTVGYNGGGWNGPWGIVSSAAAASSPGTYSLGYSDFVDGIVSPTDPNRQKILVMYTRYGDANLNGTVDFGDLIILGQNYPLGSTTAAWDQGDFDYDGTVDIDDLLLLSQNYGLS